VITIKKQKSNLKNELLKNYRLKKIKKWEGLIKEGFIFVPFLYGCSFGLKYVIRFFLQLSICFRCYFFKSLYRKQISSNNM
jgi:hypothetical protein